MFTCSQTVPYRYLIVILVQLHCAAVCIALWTPVRKSGNGISNLEWECSDLEWNGAREEQPSDFLWRCAWNS